MTKKITKRDLYTRALSLSDVQNDVELVELFQHEIELIDKRKENKKPTAEQVKNAETANAIISCMELDMLYSISDMIKTFACCAGMSNQKVFSLLKGLMADGKVKRIEDKRKVFFERISD